MLVGIILVLAAIYLVIGLLFAIAFVIKGVTAVDEGAHGSSAGFRIIILPGVALLWPVLLKKWINAKSTSHDETA
jgi:hypothetical protein